MPVPPLAEPRFDPPWAGSVRSSSRTALNLQVWDGSGPHTAVRLRRCAAGPLRDAYPAGAYDIEVTVSGHLPRPGLTELLTALVPAVWRAEPRCRRIVLAPEADDGETIAAARPAGFREVVDVDLPGERLTLLVTEPHWVTALDCGLDRVPGA